MHRELRKLGQRWGEILPLLRVAQESRTKPSRSAKAGGKTRTRRTGTKAG